MISTSKRTSFNNELNKRFILLQIDNVAKTFVAYSYYCYINYATEIKPLLFKKVQYAVRRQPSGMFHLQNKSTFLSAISHFQV